MSPIQQPAVTESTNHEHTRTGMSVGAFKRAFLDNLLYVQARFPAQATLPDLYQALAATVRDRLLQRWISTAQTYKRTSARTVCYLSAEYLPGPHLGKNLLNMGLTETARQACAELGLDLDELLEQEVEPGLGSGGLGRLAACFMESLGTLQIPAIGYGIRYEFGIFDQEIRDGWQVERTDKWLDGGNPWEIARPRLTFGVKLGGYTEHFVDDGGRYRVLWTPARVVEGVAYDTPILGYRVNTANLLRLWSAKAPESFDVKAFSNGDYYGAVEQKVSSENLSKVLYPNDEPAAGKQLRLEQQYFLVSCSLQDMLRIHLKSGGAPAGFAGKYAVQLNDTHPALAIAELMRLLVDEHHLGWDEAWDVTRNTFAYTNHTSLPEALEQWPVRLFEETLPRHLEIIYEINRRFLAEVARAFPDDAGLAARLSLVDESGGRSVRMAHLACVGSCAINGVSELHTRLLRETVLRDVHALMPQKFSNKTNGVTPRRFIALINPALTALVTEGLGGEDWVRDLTLLRGLEPLAGDPAFRAAWAAVKRRNKEALAGYIRRATGAAVDPDSLFDVQVKRIHEYKRQHLNLLHVITLYHRLRADPGIDVAPRTFIFGGKAAPGYALAKLMIKLVNCVAEVVNGDQELQGRLRVVFLPDFNVKTSRWVYPAADLSEQISLAGKEASGTGNMKFALNGALTIGTLDGANAEIRDRVGAENFFLFGLTADQVRERRNAGYAPRGIFAGNHQLRAAIELIDSGHFTRGDGRIVKPLVDALLQRDEYLALADYQSYVERQADVGRAWHDQDTWRRMSILNVARCGDFSSDRAVREYCEEIWKVAPVPIEL